MKGEGNGTLVIIQSEWRWHFSPPRSKAKGREGSASLPIIGCHRIAELLRLQLQLRNPTPWPQASSLRCLALFCVRGGSGCGLNPLCLLAMALRSLATQAATVLRLRGSPVVANSLWVPLRRTFAADADGDSESS